MMKAAHFISNKYLIIVFAVVVFGVKLFLNRYGFPNQYGLVSTVLKTLFLIIFITAALHVLSFFVLALITKKKPEHWWEHLDYSAKQVKKDNFLEKYTQALLVTIPLALYGTLVYVAVFLPWKSIVPIAIAFAVSWIISHFENKKNQRIGQNI